MEDFLASDKLMKDLFIGFSFDFHPRSPIQKSVEG
jgi:hypothetical protein